MYVQLPQDVWEARGSLWNLLRSERMGRGATFSPVPDFSKGLRSTCSVSRSLQGYGRTMETKMWYHGSHVPEVEMRITQSNTSAGVSLPRAFFRILSALLVLMGLLLVVRLRTNDNELAASPGHGHL